MTWNYPQNDESQEYARTMGSVAMLMLQNKKYQYYPMACLLAWVHPAILLKQIKLFYNEQGHPVGYLTWAFLAPDVEEEWNSDPKVMLHISEWNEGDSLWIMDLLAPSGFGRRILRYAREEMFKDFDSAKSLRRNPDGTVRR